ncbi:MAG: hypothetical protein HYZ91_04640, partial [Candidatus Omnitrophica bacterium]|nr:hypothetical protein [Candidatus Omnitrophota bacterium]
NGYSLVRKVVFDIAGLEVSDRIGDLDATVGDVLLKPTRLYTDAVLDVLAGVPHDSVTGIAHITGGGIISASHETDAFSQMAVSRHAGQAVALHRGGGRAVVRDRGGLAAGGRRPGAAVVQPNPPRDRAGVARDRHRAGRSLVA